MIFATENGTPIFPNNPLRRTLRPAAKAAGVPEAVSLYSMRHTFASLSIERGVHIPVVAEIVGHADRGQLLLKTYAGVTPRMREEAASRIAEALSASNMLKPATCAPLDIRCRTSDLRTL